MRYIGYYIYALHDKYGGAEDRAIEFERKFNEYCINNNIELRIKRIYKEEELKKIDAIIIYGAHYKNHAIVKFLKDKYNVKIILSSVFVKNGPGILYKILSKINTPKTTQRMTYEILKECDYIFTSTKYEKNLIKNIFRIDSEKISILPNLVDEQYIKDSIDEDIILPINSEIISKSYICIGRIEPIKNQLIFNDVDEHIIFIGNYNKEYNKYCRNFKNMVDNHGKFVHIKRVDKTIMLNIIKKSKGLIMPSFFETTGRVALESAILNKPLFVTNLDTVKEYLVNYKHIKFFNPRDNRELKLALNDYQCKNSNVLNEELDFCYGKGIDRYVTYFEKVLSE